jgi:8-oxo-dGTP pyrophosphatase MutT (NUDIX family)
VTQGSSIPQGAGGRLNEGTPVTPRPASTVLVLDAAESPWQVLMMRRPGGAEFAPGAYVFPGGSVHAEDREFDDADRSAAVRELFEEVGLLLARLPDQRFADDRECAALRERLAAGATWPAALHELELAPAFDRLVFLARWITPERVPRRFDTRFYLAERPLGQTVHPQPGEVVDTCWTTPAAALTPDGLSMIFATRRILESVASEPDAVAFIARLRGRPETPPVMPRLIPRPEGGYDVVEEVVAP